MSPLPRSFYDRDAEAVAVDLLGTLLVRRVGETVRIGRVVETEAYLGPADLAAHTSKGRTARTEVIFGPPGHAYVYLIYGIHHCLNAVTGPGESASAVLLRALEPVAHLDGRASGPGLLCKAMAIDRSLYGVDLTGPGADLFLARADRPGPFEVVARPRVGVDYAGPDWAARPLRFSIRGNPHVSRARST